MMNTIALILIAVMCSGCVTAQRIPPESTVKGLRVITVVPIEAPPLLVHPKTDADRAAVTGAGLGAPGPGGSVNGGYLLLLPLVGFVGTAGIYGIASSTPRAGEAIIIVRQSAPWMPTPALAQTASQLLQRVGTREVVVVEGYGQLPIKDRSVNVFLENWMAPIRRWYNAEVSTLDYTQLGTPRADVVLEVGVLNYEYIGNRMLLQVMVKMSDPTTKQVLGRARSYDHPKGESLAVMLRDQGQPMQHLIETLGESLLTQCLKDLGLIPR
jgi:hypothetical protein